ncbi:MAG: hypothetical protein ABSF95_05085 [Verrucomicrobiota bacterium]|jgi:hypothetical protein
MARLSAAKPLPACGLGSKNTAKFPNTANPANPANGAFGIPPKTRYNHHPVNAKLRAPLRFALGQEAVPARFNALCTAAFALICSYFHLTARCLNDSKR